MVKNGGKYFTKRKNILEVKLLQKSIEQSTMPPCSSKQSQLMTTVSTLA